MDISCIPPVTDTWGGAGPRPQSLQAWQGSNGRRLSTELLLQGVLCYSRMTCRHGNIQRPRYLPVACSATVYILSCRQLCFRLHLMHRGQRCSAPSASNTHHSALHSAHTTRYAKPHAQCLQCTQATAMWAHYVQPLHSELTSCRVHCVKCT